MLIALLAVNLETSDKVNGQPWNFFLIFIVIQLQLYAFSPLPSPHSSWTALTFRRFQMHFWIPLLSKVIHIPLESTTDPADLYWGVIPENGHEMAAKTSIWNT